MKYIEVSDAIETTWMILEGLGYVKSKNPGLAKTIEDVYASAPSINLVGLVSQAHSASYIPRYCNVDLGAD